MDDCLARSLIASIYTVALIGVLAVPSAMQGQRITPEQLVTPRALSAVDPRHTTVVTTDHVPSTLTMWSPSLGNTRNSGKTVRYTLIGAGIGAAVLGGIALHQSAHCDDCFFKGPFIIAATAAGGIGGGLIGWIVARTN